MNEEKSDPFILTLEAAICQFVTAEPVLLLELGNLYKAKGSRTFSVKEKKWLTKFKLEKQYADAAGLYCFWLVDVPDFTKEDLTHWIQGKQYSKKDKHRIHDVNQKVDYVKTTNGKKSKVKYIFHGTTWDLPNVAGRVPLYIGKSSNLFKRIRLHLAWPNKFVDAKPDDNKVIKNNTSTQFRSAFEFLFRRSELSDEDRFAKVGLTIIPTEFHAIQERFYWENYLIGKYRPPFNLDSER